MPIYVDEMSSNLTVLDGELPLDETQLEHLVQLVLRRLEDRQRAAKISEASTTLRRNSAPPPPIGE